MPPNPRPVEPNLGLPEFRIQERDWFKESRHRFTEEMNLAERPTMLQEDVASMDSNLQRLGSVLNDFKAKWMLDGALNISALRGEYVGFHKDIDVSLESDQLNSLAQSLASNGENSYGLFHSYKQDGKKYMERVSPESLKQEAEGRKRIVAAIDEHGKIKDGGALLFFEGHIIKRDEQGKPLGKAGVRLPEKWLVPQVVDFHGAKLNLSHPARVAYYKLHSAMSSPYHIKDLETLAETKTLSEEDVNDIEHVINEEAKQYDEVRAKHLISAVAELRKRVASS